MSLWPSNIVYIGLLHGHMYVLKSPIPTAHLCLAFLPSNPLPISLSSHPLSSYAGLKLEKPQKPEVQSVAIVSYKLVKQKLINNAFIDVFNHIKC